MTAASPARPEHVDELRTFEKIIRHHAGFQLILALYNDPAAYRDRLIAHLGRPASQAGRFDVRHCADFAEFEHQLAAACAAADWLHIVGLDAWLGGPECASRLQGFNLHREALAASCGKPVVLWLPVHLATPFALQAPDIWEWRRVVLDFSVVPEAVPDALAQLMQTMQRKLPEQREPSSYANLELALRGLSPSNRKRARALGLFHGGANLAVLRVMMGWTEKETRQFGNALAKTGLASHLGHGHLRLDPALSPYLLAQMAAPERERLQSRWLEAMLVFVEYLVQQQQKDAVQAAALTGWELPNLMALLELTAQAGDAATTIALCERLFLLLQFRDKPQALERIAQVREAAGRGLGAGHAYFQAQRNRIEHALTSGRLAEALETAQALHRRTLAMGTAVYPEAEYDKAAACYLLGQTLQASGAATEALSLHEAAQAHFESLAPHEPAAESMVAAALGEQGNCLLLLGRCDQAAAAYEAAMRRAEQRGDLRLVATEKFNLGTVRLQQGRPSEALAAYAQARASFAMLDEPGSVANVLYQTGMAHEDMGGFDAAERAYREAMAAWEQLGDTSKQALTLTRLGNLYGKLGRLEDAVRYCRQAADRLQKIGDAIKEGVARSNLAGILLKLGRTAEARVECRLALKVSYGHAAEPWETWAVLSAIESADGQTPAAAAARDQALQLFLAYRRDGGENHTYSGKLCAVVAEHLAAGQADAVTEALREVRNSADLPTDYLPLLDALDAITVGQRGPALADNPALSYDQAAEILLLLERLPKQ